MQNYSPRSPSSYKADSPLRSSLPEMAQPVPKPPARPTSANYPTKTFQGLKKGQSKTPRKEHSTLISIPSAALISRDTLHPLIVQPVAPSLPIPPQKPKRCSPISSKQPRNPHHMATDTIRVICTVSTLENVPIFHKQQSASSTATPSMPLSP